MYSPTAGEYRSESGVRYSNRQRWSNNRDNRDNRDRRGGRYSGGGRYGDDRIDRRERYDRDRSRNDRDRGDSRDARYAFALLHHIKTAVIAVVVDGTAAASDLLNDGSDRHRQPTTTLLTESDVPSAATANRRSVLHLRPNRPVKIRKGES
jgi:hypothetical protein